MRSKNKWKREKGDPEATSPLRGCLVIDNINN